MPVSKQRIKALEKKLGGAEKDRARLFFSVATVEEAPDGKEEEFIKELWQLWKKAGYPKDLDRFAKAIWVREPEKEGDISVFGKDREKGIEQRAERMKKRVKEIIKEE